MSNFAVLHATKFSGSGGGIGSHIDRKHTPKNADPKRQYLNRELIPSRTGSMKKDIDLRIKEGYDHRNKKGELKAIRKDAVKAIGVMLSGSHEKMKEIVAGGKLDDWVKANRAFAEKQFGKENLVRFTLHMDEKTPHIHCVFVPLKDGRLNQKAFIDGKADLRKLQDNHAKTMEPFGLQRGVRHSRMRHTTTREYYRDLEHMAEDIEIQTNIVGQPKKGEDERLKEMYEVMAAEIYESNRLLQKEKNLRPQWEEKIKQEYVTMSRGKDETEKLLKEVKALKINQEEIISRRIKEKDEENRSKLSRIFKERMKEMEEEYKKKESMVDEMIKTRHIERTLKIVNSHLQEQFNVDYKIGYNKKKDSFHKESVMRKRDKGHNKGFSHER